MLVDLVTLGDRIGKDLSEDRMSALHCGQCEPGIFLGRRNFSDVRGYKSIET